MSKNYFYFRINLYRVKLISSIISLGTTQITQDVFDAFIEEMGGKYNMNTYDLFNNNCNNFTNDASQFLTGKPIPQRIIDLPQQFLQSQIGQALLPLIRSFTGQGGFDQNAVVFIFLFFLFFFKF